MTEYDRGPGQPPVSGWAVGGITFAAAMMLLIGIFQVLGGLAAIIEDEFFVLTANYAFDIDVTAWGWIHLLLGILLIVAAWGLFSAQVWAGIVALTLSILSAVANFFYIPYYPWWALLVIALNVWVIWALTRPGALRST